jgi:hypothetical protein
MQAPNKHATTDLINANKLNVQTDFLHLPKPTKLQIAKKNTQGTILENNSEYKKRSLIPHNGD